MLIVYNMGNLAFTIITQGQKDERCDGILGISRFLLHLTKNAPRHGTSLHMSLMIFYRLLNFYFNISSHFAILPIFLLL